MTVNPSRIRLLIVDDHPMLRDGVAAMVCTQPDMELAGQASTAEDGVALFRLLTPDVTLMDIRMPGMDGVEAIERIRADAPDARVLVLTTYADDAQALRALRAGAAGYLLKSSLRRELIDTIRAVHDGRRTAPPSVAKDIAAPMADDAPNVRPARILAMKPVWSPEPADGNWSSAGSLPEATRRSMHTAPAFSPALSVDPDFFDLLAGSYARLTGIPLIEPGKDAAWLYRDAPFAVLAHNGEADPRFVYANRTAQACFEYPWEEFIALPSRLSAEAPDRAERQRLLDAVTRNGFVTGYSGIRVARSGRRFRIENGLVWQLIDRDGTTRGQAATFSSWHDI